MGADFQYTYNGFIKNLTTIKQIGNKFKLSTMKIPIRKEGFHYYYAKKNSVNDKKLDNNNIRAKTTIKELALCNEFEWFCTFTLDKLKYDRYNLPVFIKDLGQFIRDYRKKYNANIQYILIPEQHIDGAWHMHGLFKNILPEHLVNFDNITNAPNKLKGKGYFNFILYEKKFGFNSMGLIRDKEKVSSYITKYINKNLGSNIELGKKSYYNSRGLNKPITIKKGTLQSTLDYEFENDYVKLKWFSEQPNLLFD